MTSSSPDTAASGSAGGSDPDGGSRATVAAADTEGSLVACLERLEEAIEAADGLRVETTAARAVRDTARERLGFPGRAYVLALAGGTGVGKSSVLNALAGGVVSDAGVRRPTTAEPVAWVPRAERHDLGPLLAWLGVQRVREHGEEALGSVAIIDLPDLDSITTENRARVDELLPRLDAVAWVADPEKYQDALLHDRYVRAWGGRLGRQVVVLNKADRVTPADAARLRDDLARQLRAEGFPDLPIVLTSALDGRGGVDELRRWLAARVEAKRIVTARVASEVRATVRDLADRAGAAADGTVAPLLDAARRARAVQQVEREVLAVIDLAGLERQAVAATRLAARPRGGGPMGHVTSLLYRWSGREQAAADPSGYLRRWRGRGSLARAVEPVRRLVADVLPEVPPPARPALVAATEPGPLQGRLTEAIDRAVSAPGVEFRAPTSALWWLIGAAQFAVTALLLFTALWLVVLWVAPGGEVARTELPLVGPVPQPLVLLAVGLLAGYVLARLLGLHAGWLGRRWARRLRGAVAAEVDRRLAEAVFAPLEALDRARERLGAAARAVQQECRSRGP